MTEPTYRRWWLRHDPRASVPCARPKRARPGFGPLDSTVLADLAAHIRRYVRKNGIGPPSALAESPHCAYGDTTREGP